MGLSTIGEALERGSWGSLWNWTGNWTHYYDILYLIGVNGTENLIYLLKKIDTINNISTINLYE